MISKERCRFEWKDSNLHICRLAPGHKGSHVCDNVLCSATYSTEPTDTERLDWWQEVIDKGNGGRDNTDIFIDKDGEFCIQMGFPTLREALDNAMAGGKDVED